MICHEVCQPHIGLCHDLVDILEKNHVRYQAWNTTLLEQINQEFADGTAEIVPNGGEHLVYAVRYVAGIYSTECKPNDVSSFPILERLESGEKPVEAITRVVPEGRHPTFITFVQQPFTLSGFPVELDCYRKIFVYLIG